MLVFPWLNILTYFFQDFKRNLKKTNGQEDFEEEMLEEIYNAIR